MKKYFALSLVLLFACLIFYAADVACVKAEELEYSWGTVSNVSAGQIVVSEYDYETNNKVNVTYSISSDVELYNVDSLQEIQVGDYIDIEYEVQDNKKIAKIINVEDFSEDKG